MAPKCSNESTLPIFSLDDIDTEGEEGNDKHCKLSIACETRGEDESDHLFGCSSTVVYPVYWKASQTWVVLKDVALPTEDTVTDVLNTARIIARIGMECDKPVHRQRGSYVLRYYAFHMESPTHFQWMTECCATSLRQMLPHWRLGASTLPEMHCKVIVIQLLRALEHLHDCAAVVHMDVSLANILLVKKVGVGDSAKSLQIRLGDLESAVPVGVSPRSYSGTPMYSPLEVLQDSETLAHPSADMWSLGIVLFQLLSTSYAHPWAADECNADHREVQPYWAFLECLLRAKESDSLWERLCVLLPLASEDARRVVFQCLMWDPEKRPTARHLLASSWLQELSTEQPSYF